MGCGVDGNGGDGVYDGEDYVLRSSAKDLGLDTLGVGVDAVDLGVDMLGVVVVVVDVDLPVGMFVVVAGASAGSVVHDSCGSRGTRADGERGGLHRRHSGGRVTNKASRRATKEADRRDERSSFAIEADGKTLQGYVLAQGKSTFCGSMVRLI